MEKLIDKFFLLLCCFINILFIKFDISFIIGFLLILIETTFTYFLNSKRFCYLFGMIYIIMGYFFPPVLLFIPVLIYDTLFFHKAYSILLTLFTGCFLIQTDNLTSFIYCTSICLLGFLLFYKTQSFEDLQVKFKKTRDDSTELNLLLKHKNQSILEKQDYEIYTATLRERNRIAREIHDNVGHMLSRSILMMGALKAINQQPLLEQPLSQLEDTLNGAMNSVRQSVHDLHDDSIDLKIVIENLVNDFDFCDISLDYDLHKDLPRELKYSFISIAKEALANIMKHSNATKVQITMREHPGLYQLIIKDNGTMTASITTSGISSVTSSTTASGIGSMISNATTSGIGLINIQERVGLLHGTLHIIRNTGFELFITIPKERI